MKGNEKSHLTPASQRLRRQMTKEERHLWYDCLSRLSVTVNRQKVIGPYIVDFCCSKAMLVIEADGSQHYEADGVQSDRERDAFLSDKGYLVLRYSNYDINRNFTAVCDDLLAHISARLSELVFFKK